MSKRRSIILSVVLEGRSQAETARLFDVSESWVSRLVARHRVEGDAAFEARPRRPKSSPTRLDEPTINAIIELRTELTAEGLDAGPETIRWHLQQHHNVMVSVSTIRRRLVDAGLVTPQPRKRPKSSYVRFEADLPNECWQTDFTHWYLADRTDTEILTWLDDHSRYALSVTVHTPVTGNTVTDTFTQTAETHGFPASVLSDNAFVYTTRFAGGRGGRNHLETTLAALGVEQKHSRANHPTTCGKVERFQQTLKKWLTAQPRATTLSGLQDQLDHFTDEYNQRRPHRSIGRTTPAVAYQRLPKTGPQGSTAGVHYRIRRDRIDDTGSVSLRRAGRMHHIGIGRTHAGTPVILLIEDLNIRVIATQTGDLLRRLTLDPNRGYQPRFKN
ncbi:MAG: IS481 family transposase [Acidimicrobiales bacterium]